MVGAIDIGGTKTIVALVQEDGTIVASERFPTCRAHCEAHLDACCEALQRLLCGQGLDVWCLSGIGATVPGIVDEKGQKLVHCAYPDWNRKPIGHMLGGRMGGLPVLIENDVNACALAELRFSAGGLHDFLWVTVSTGVGGAVVSGGRLVRGSKGFAGELGHIKVEYGRPCVCPSCGGRGCLEAHGSGRALDRMFRLEMKRNSQLAALVEGQGLPADGRGCAALAQQGVPQAVACFRRLGSYLGRGLGAAVNVLNPQAVILGGGVADSFSLMYNFIMETFCSCVHPSLMPVQLLHTGLGYHAALLGAAALALKGK